MALALDEQVDEAIEREVKKGRTREDIMAGIQKDVPKGTETTVRGQVLGLLGNTGNSSEPHLHFHICDRGSELACEGLPYHLTSFDVLGKGFGWKPSAAPPAESRSNEQPLQNAVVRFS